MNLDVTFHPHTIALIGASRDEQSVGSGLLKNLLSKQYMGSVYPVNPKAQMLQGVPCYPSIKDIPSQVDLAIIAVPAHVVIPVVEEAIVYNIQSIIVISAGFKEQGHDGKEREETLVALCKKNSIALIGPNCLGILNPHIGLNASFETVLPAKGSIACISQSGALISSLLDIANERGIGFSKIVSVGNKAVVTENELLPYLFDDPETSVITLYTEALHDAPELIGLLRRNQLSQHPKPIIMLKAGVTEEGQHASSSHTGSLAGSDMAYEALCKQSGIIRVHTMDELLTTAHIFATNPLPKGNNIVIVTNAGGPGIIATDEASRFHLSLAHFSEQTKQQLTAMLPANSHPVNPVDLLGDASSERYEKALGIIAKDDNVNSIVVIVTPQTMTDIPETAAAIVRIRNTIQKPIVASFIGAEQIEPGQMILSSTHVAHSQFPEPAVTALGHLTMFANHIRYHSSTVERIENVSSVVSFSIPPHDKALLLDTSTVFSLLKQANILVVSSALAQTSQEAEEKALQMNCMLAMKVVSPDISHKTDVGGVMLNVLPEKAKEAFTTILENIRSHVPHARTDGVLLTQMVEEEGAEFFVGMKKEPLLGTLILVGLGGIYVEILRDIESRFAPLTHADAIQMIQGLKGNKILEGVRGKEALDTHALADIVVHVGTLALQIPEIKELDINPVFVQTIGKGALVLDARIIVE
jgi:acetyltransferase